MPFDFFSREHADTSWFDDSRPEQFTEEQRHQHTRDWLRLSVLGNVTLFLVLMLLITVGHR